MDTVCKKNGGDACPEEARGRGRPKLLDTEARETLILNAMERVLMSRGLHGASMSAIAREAGMSKRTVYQVFESREALFTACIRRIRLSLVRPLHHSEACLPVRERLWRMLTPDMRLAASGTPLAVLRAVVAEAQRHPGLAHTFMAEGPNAARCIVRAELDRAVARGEIRCPDTALAARILCDMVYESPIDRLVTADATPQTAAEAETRLATALDIFLGGVTP